MNKVNISHKATTQVHTSDCFASVNVVRPRAPRERRQCDCSRYPSLNGVESGDAMLEQFDQVIADCSQVHNYRDLN
jgi:hypothetical protein